MKDITRFLREFIARSIAHPGLGGLELSGHDLKMRSINPDALSLTEQS